MLIASGDLRRYLILVAITTALMLSSTGALAADSLAVIDLNNKTTAEIATIRKHLIDSGTFKAEIKTGANGDQPDAMIFQSKRMFDQNSFLSLELDKKIDLTSLDYYKRYVSDGDNSKLLGKLKLQPLKPATTSCSTAITLASSNGVTGGAEPDVDQVGQKEFFKSVERNCMNPLMTGINALNASAPAWAQDERVGDVAGVLFTLSDGAKTPFCSALLYTASHVVTARHCLFNEELGDPNARGKAMERGNLYFELARSDVQPIAIKRAYPSAILDPHPFSYDEDVVLLDLEHDSPFMPPTISFRNPVQGEELLVAGIADHITPDDASAGSLLRFPANAECRTLIVSDSCVRHNCQSSMGFSGAPMFAALDDQEAQDHMVRVAGFHLGQSILAACKNAASSTIGDETTGNEGIVASAAQTFINTWLASNASQP